MEQILDQNLENKTEPIFTIKKEYPSIGQAFGLIGVFVLITIAVALPAELVREKLSPGIQPALNGITYVLSMGILLLFGIKMRKSLKFQWNMVSIPVLLLTIPMILSLGILIEPLISAIPMPEFIKEYFNNVLTKDIYTFLMISLAAPLLEELVFRGVVLQGFLKRYSPAKAIIWSAVIFGVAHLNPWQFLAAFPMGLVIGWVYWKTNSLVPGMLIHFINNSSAFLMLLITNNNFATTQQMMGDGRAYYIFYGMCIPIFIGSLFLIQQRLKMKEA
jgi:membrane protease YdiL (CAAX protease family)